MGVRGDLERGQWLLSRIHAHSGTGKTWGLVGWSVGGVASVSGSDSWKRTWGDARCKPVVGESERCKRRGAVQVPGASMGGHSTVRSITKNANL